jgi:hypothetical protein
VKTASRGQHALDPAAAAAGVVREQHHCYMLHHLFVMLHLRMKMARLLRHCRLLGSR